MVICKYFLQGTCRFGDNCKFEHQINNDHNYTTATSPLLQSYANKPPQTTSSTTNVDTNTLIKSVVNDMTSAEKGGQWLLSSYAPFKEKPAFPGFEDYSMEEIRHLFYESIKNGTVEQFKQNLQMMLQQAVMKIKALQNPSPEAVNMLKTIYNTAPSSSFGGQQQSSSVFGGSPQSQQQKSGIFGGAAASQNVFGGTTASTNIFGGSQPPQQSIFGGNASNNSVFGGAQSGTSVFGNQQQTANNTKSIFGNAQPQPPSSTNTTSVFGGGFANSGAPSVFAQTPFGQQNQQQVPFPAPQQNIFHQNQFGGLQNTNNQLPPPTGGEQKSAFQHTANIFGNLNVPSQTSGFGQTAQTKPNEEFYSKLEELSQDDINWFQSDDLDISKIPEKPPTYEMCFRG